MGMTIDDCIKMLIAKEKCMKREISGIDTDCNLDNCDNCSLCYEQGNVGEQKMALLFAVDAMRQYKLLQADYENRIKADLVAMLTDIQLEIEEKFNDRPFSYNHHQRTEFYRDIDEVIQQKINSLKENKE